MTQTLPDGVPPCGYRKGRGKRICFCHHPSAKRKTVDYDECRQCPLADATASPPVTTRDGSAFKTTCQHLGEVIHNEPCSCGSAVKIPIHRCDKLTLCVLTKHELSKVKNADTRSHLERRCCETCPHHSSQPQWVSGEDLGRDTRTLISKLPANVTRICGVARSGVRPASDVAMSLHLPMDTLDQTAGAIGTGGHGWRLKTGQPDDSGTVVVIDDTCMTGESQKAIRPIAEQHYAGRHVIFATVYCNPLAKHRPDIVARSLPWPHLLEWNLFNSVLVPSCAFDFDGILCRDCPATDDDDGPRYQRFLTCATPLHLVRRCPIPLIVTARLEKYRQQTEDWLQRHGVRFERLVMGPWETLAERSRSDVAAYKAEHYREFLNRPVSLEPRLFVESDPRQAERIAQLSGGLVLCPEAGRVF